MEKRNKRSLFKGIMEKNLRLQILLKLAVSFYFILATFNYLLSETDAYFLSEGELGISLKTGEWLFPDLSFAETESELIDYCPLDFTVPITNQGSADLSEPALYQVYFIDSGHPKNGEKISEGTIETLAVDDTFELFSDANQTGLYAVKVLYTASENKEERWSNIIQVQCTEKPAGNNQDGTQNSGVTETGNEDQNVENNTTPQNNNEEASEPDSNIEGNEKNKGNKSNTENKEKTTGLEDSSLNNNYEDSLNEHKKQNGNSSEDESSLSSENENKTESP